MKDISIGQIATIFLVVFILSRSRQIVAWFKDALSGFEDFPEGAQTAIAFSLILLVAVMIFKTVNKKK